MLANKINSLKNWQVALIIIFVGLAVFFSGLGNNFLGDDEAQIVNNPVVHSLSHLPLFFEGGTFYIGKSSSTPLYGAYYRPLMTTTYSIIYSIVGLHAFYYHLVQLLFVIASAFLLYLFFQKFLKPALALFLALIFLVHPIDSQLVFAISAMQDALFFFFGILALYILITFKSTRSLIFACLSLFLSLLAKETGIAFIIMSLIYLYWWDRKRLLKFSGLIVLPLIAWFVLRWNAIGLHTNPRIAPIDHLSIFGRLMTDPSILLFYFTKLLWPYRLASEYFWVYPHFSFLHTLLPLIIDVAVISLFIYIGRLVYKHGIDTQRYLYLFFGIWFAAGLVTLLQIYPLDMTACENWFYFSMAGLLGMVGVAIDTLRPVYRLSKQTVTTISAVLIVILVILGIRTALRGRDWSSEVTLAKNNIVASKQDYDSYNILATNYSNLGDYNLAASYLQKSLNVEPTFSNYDLLGVLLTREGDYGPADIAFNKGLKYGNYEKIYEDQGELVLIHGSSKVSVEFLTYAVGRFPQDPLLWQYLAMAEENNGNPALAKEAISKAADLGQISSSLYESVMSGNSIKVTLPDTKKTIIVR